MSACPTCRALIGACAHCHQPITDPPWASLTDGRGGGTRHLHYHQACLDAGEVVDYLAGTGGLVADLDDTADTPRPRPP